MILIFVQNNPLLHRNNSCGIKHCIGASYQRQHLSSYFPFPKRTFSLGCLQINYLAIQSNAFLSFCLGLVWQTREPSSKKQVRLLCSKFLFRRVKCRRKFIIEWNFLHRAMELGEKTHAALARKQMHDQNGHSRFPALCAVCSFSPCLLLGS